jgi:RNA polymerase sigma-70 factor (sigma-E family)
MTFEEFATARLPALLRYGMLLTRDPEQARDLVQDVLAQAIPRWKRIGAVDEPYAYVRAMITNEYLSLLRRRKLRTVPLTYEALNGPRAPTASDPADRFDNEDLWRRLAVLPRKQRAVVVLRYYEELTDNEIADVLGCRASTVRSHATRALATLRVRLTPGETPGDAPGETQRVNSESGVS